MVGVEQNTLSIEQVVARARRAYWELLGCTEEDRNHALGCIADALDKQKADILKANAQDLALADTMVQANEMKASLRARLVFDTDKLKGVLAGIEQVVRLPNPSGRTLWRTELDRGLVLSRVTCPLGVIGVVFESRPDVVVQVSSLLLKAGNAGILKGGKEAQHTNAALMDAVGAGLRRAGSVPSDALQLVSTREDVEKLLGCSGSIDLLIPRGSKELVSAIQRRTTIPVLGHTDGVCHVYIHRDADRDKALRVTVDAKTDYPAACNAAETILMDEDAAPALLKPLLTALRNQRVEIRACEKARQLAPELLPASEDDWYGEYLDLVVSLKLVQDCREAVTHINHYGSHHTDAIVTENQQAAAYFCRHVDSAGVFVNASTRFADGYRYGLGAEIGISTNKIHARGPVGLEGIVTYKYELQGTGHAAADYGAGPGKRQFTHRQLNIADDPRSEQ